MNSLPVTQNVKTADTDTAIRYTVERGIRRSCQITVGKDGTVTVKMPLLSSDKDAEELVIRHRRWILRRLSALQNAAEEENKALKLSADEKKELRKKAQSIFPGRAEYYAALIGVDYRKISFRFQRTRWGSCTRNGNLSFNCLLVLAPPEVLDSVVVHELCHRRVMNHSSRFYGEVFKVFPQYRKCNDWLKKHGRELTDRV